MNVKRGLLGEGGIIPPHNPQNSRWAGSVSPSFRIASSWTIPNFKIPRDKRERNLLFWWKEATFADFAAVLWIKAFPSKNSVVCWIIHLQKMKKLKTNKSEFQTKTFLSNLILYYTVTIKCSGMSETTQTDIIYKLGNTTYEKHWANTISKYVERHYFLFGTLSPYFVRCCTHEIKYTVSR